MLFEINRRWRGGLGGKGIFYYLKRKDKKEGASGDLLVENTMGREKVNEHSRGGVGFFGS